MRYDDVVAAVFRPSPPGVRPTTDASTAPARRLRDAIEPIAMHAVWSRSVNEHIEARGLDFLSGYVWGRAAALGEPTPEVVAATFAWFEPGMITAVYSAGRAACSRDEVLAARAEAANSLGEVLAGIDVASVASALRSAVETLDRTGRPLFAGLAGEPWPDQPAGQLWRACELLREHRGDSHVAASVAAGLSGIEMNVLTECWLGMPITSYSATRGWSPDALGAAMGHLEAAGLLSDGELTSAGRDRRGAVEAVTNVLETPVVDALGERIDELINRLAEWSDLCVAAGAFPPDVFKRAAG